MNFFKQIGALTSIIVRDLPKRAGTSLVTVFGIASTVAVMLSLLAVGGGLMKTGTHNERADRAIVVPSSGASDSLGALSQSAAAIIGDTAGVKHDAAGKPMVQPQALVMVVAKTKADGSNANLGFNGTGAQGWAMDPDLKLTSGRMYRPGLHELLVGRFAQKKFTGFDVGSQVRLHGVDWTVVGVFEDGGSYLESTLLTDVDTLLPAFGRTAYGNLKIQLDSSAAFPAVQQALTHNPQIAVLVKRETDFNQEQFRPLTALTNFLAYFVGTVMALGAIFAAINTMYTLIDARSKEIATLRAVGFGAFGVVIAMMLTSLVLAVPSAVLGAAAALAIFGGRAVSSAGLTFPLQITPQMAVQGVVWSVVIGLIGGLLPAIRAGRLSVTRALKAS